MLVTGATGRVGRVVVDLLPPRRRLLRQLSSVSQPTRGVSSFSLHRTPHPSSSNRLRQDPGRAPESPAETRTYRKRKGWCMAEYAVVIAGGGPTGMMLAAELALAKVDVVIVERRAS